MTQSLHDENCWFGLDTHHREWYPWIVAVSQARVRARYTGGYLRDTWNEPAPLWRRR